ncbi:TPA: restriction endonuclease subunit S [Pseudomonas aeruginosa]|uniref:restriction endonuclease subunit S n=1 Tax=Pseudomonas aeruginosa TaxID=287 RepID=UPI0018C5D634|nr:restriction endonuclease subunit S [Pseudomonas aeruginosa]MBG4707305.1 restriction endonuclease subunit S [Pseudomonas aeruginosa]MBI8511919.1 restriction endonuclease subunit S [Pseudomonas aeruginosa]HCL3287108.1 restriction endonuclease subunit S [Pseudomonas aeruginosa]HEJ3144886.1 restriction endonuclease subunit S [Pseudomonas aeruginosa]HEK1282083.1 restriction endonuclease subunit S [Pseudomonas aeruginosa]
MSEFSDEAMQSYPFADVTLPLSWSLVALEEVSADVSPGFASGKHNSDGAGVPHLRPMNVDRDGQIDLKVVKSVAESNGIELRQGDVLFNNTNSAELVGKTAVVSTREGGFAFSNHMTRIRPEDGVSSVFVARQLHFLWMAGYMKHRCTNHVNQASISSKTLAKTIPFLLPPAAEQTRIVAKLEELLSDLDAGVAELKAAQNKLEQYRQSLLKAAVEGALTAEWRIKNPPSETGAQLLERILSERRSRWEAKQFAKFAEQGKAPPKDWQKKYPEPVQPDTTGLPALPEGWVWSSLGECFQVVVGATPSRKEVDYWNGAIPWVSSGEVRFNRIRDTKERITDAGLSNSSTQINPIGSVLLGMIGEGKTRGQVAILDIPAANNQNCAAIWVSESGVPPEFVYNWLYSQYEQTRRSSSGNNQPALNKSIVERIPMPLPPLAEMQEIARVVEATLEQIASQEQVVAFSLKQSTAQRQNILRAAFAGQLVPQDPNDEPASVMLERIRAERAERVKQPKTRKTKPKEIAIMVSQLIDVLAEAGDWVPAQEAFRRCGVADGALTERIEELYAELRKLDKAGRLAVEAVTDAQGRKLYDKLKLLVG